MFHQVETVSIVDLLAVLLHSATDSTPPAQLAERLLTHYGGLKGIQQASRFDLEQHFQLTEEQAARLTAALEIGRRLVTFDRSERPVIRNADDAIRVVADMMVLDQEHVRLILLDASQRLITVVTVYIGTLTASVIRVSELFREAIVRNSPAFILAHNHPSGDASPSPEDVELTHTLIAAGRLLDIQLVDHLIIGQGTWTSFKEMGLAFSTTG